MLRIFVIVLIGYLIEEVTAFWRLPCLTPLVQERADPIVSPGSVSAHLHTIMGGNAFDFSMDYSSTQASTCSSCTVKGDFSNYWTPVLFYKHKNGTFEKVDQIGGATVYYLQRSAPGETITAFPKDFRMVAGDPFKRAPDTDAASQAVSYNCLNYNGPAQPETDALPTNTCPDGIRSQIFFPSCWDGKNLDSPNHRTHVSYPEGAYNAGKCPSTHPIRMVSLFYEIIWNTDKFTSMWYDNTQPFVWSMGDPTGYGFHGDFLNGWNTTLLQTAIDTCTSNSGLVEDCPVFNLFPSSTSQNCIIPYRISEPITGILPSLPGCNPIQPGPSRATSVSCPNSPPISTTPSQSPQFTDLTQKGWKYLGCADDNSFNRSLTLASTDSDMMMNNACVDFCHATGYSLAATEYSRECYCGDVFPWDRMPVAGVIGGCDMLCSGNGSQICGGRGRMSLFRYCDGGQCDDQRVGRRDVRVGFRGRGRGHGHGHGHGYGYRKFRGLSF